MSAGWYTAGILIAPVADVILADTGPMQDAGSMKIHILLSATVQGTAAIEHRNAANDASIRYQIVCFSAFQPYTMEIPVVHWATGERFRVRLNENLPTAAIQASIFLI